jgi:hypothetical protein
LCTARGCFKSNAGFFSIHPRSTQNRKKARRIPIFVRAVPGASVHFSRYLDSSSIPTASSGRPPNSPERPCCIRRYFRSVSSLRERASQSAMYRSSASFTETIEAPVRASQSRTIFCADSQFLIPRDFRIMRPWSRP